jgi:hypothetical protein
MIPDEWDVAWGGWVLGDLADTLRCAADLLGRSRDVSQVVLAAPATVEDRPGVTITVPDQGGIARTRTAVLEGEYLVDFVGRPSEHGWTAEVAGMVLGVRLEEF